MQSLDQVGPSASDLQSRAAAAFRALADLIEAWREPAPAAPPDPADDEMLTVAEAASRFKRSEAFIRAQCRSGRLKAMKDGHGYRIRSSAMRAYEQRRTGVGVLRRAGIVAALALLGSAAQADVFDAVAIAAAASDVVITETGLRRGFEEQNIGNRGARVGANIALTGGVLLLAREVEKDGHRGWARAIKVSYTLAFVAIAGKNIHTMRTARIR